MLSDFKLREAMTMRGLLTWIKKDLKAHGISDKACYREEINAHVITFNNREDMLLYKLFGDRLFVEYHYYYFYRVKKPRKKVA